nr:Uncharacterised protein [Raoultella sp. NCTC 9187]
MSEVAATIAIEDFNRLDDEAARGLLQPCVAIPAGRRRWCRAVLTPTAPRCWPPRRRPRSAGERPSWIGR